MAWSVGSLSVVSCQWSVVSGPLSTDHHWQLTTDKSHPPGAAWFGVQLLQSGFFFLAFCDPVHQTEKISGKFVICCFVPAFIHGSNLPHGWISEPFIKGAFYLPCQILLSPSQATTTNHKFVPLIYNRWKGDEFTSWCTTATYKFVPYIIDKRRVTNL